MRMMRAILAALRGRIRRKKARPTVEQKGAAKKRPAVKKGALAKVRAEPDEILRTAFQDFRKSIAKLAHAYNAVGLPLKSLEVLCRIPVDARTDGIWLLLAIATAKLGDLKSCSGHLARIDTRLLTEAKLVLFHRLKCQLLEGRGNFDEVLAYLATISAETLPIQLEIIRLDALAALRRDDEASEGYLNGIASPTLTAGFASAAIDYFHNRNNQRQALAIAIDACRTWPRNERLRTALCRAYWCMGELPSFVHAVRRALASSTFVGSSFANHVVRARRIDPSIGPLIDEALAKLAAKASKGVGYSDIDGAYAAITLGRHDIAETIARRYLDNGGVAPMARLILAMGKIAEGERGAAIAEIKAVVEQAPQMDAAYYPLFLAAAGSEATLVEVAPIIEARRTRVARYRKVDSFGRTLFPNPELVQLHYIQGDHKKGLVEKSGRPAQSFLTYLAPGVRPPVRDFDLSGGKSLFLIGDDGVSDEVRWSQYYDEMTRRFDRIEATCDPRLRAIMERSFPSIQFHAVARFWPDLPKRFSDLREDVPNWEVAHYLDGAALRKLVSFERVAFTNEVVLSSVMERGALTPVAVEGGHLKPDPLRKQQWAATISGIAGSRKRVGLLWRSGLLNRRRNQFYFEGETLRPLLGLSDCAFFLLQHAATPEEISWCRENGIHVLDVDLFDDLEGVAALVSELDVVVGPSTLPLEMAAAVGTPVIIPGINLHTVAARLVKGGDARCRMTANAYLACDPLGYVDPDADLQDRLDRIMTLVAEEIRSGRYGSGLVGY